MQVVIVGAGFTGLSAAHELNKQGIDVTIIEASDKPGGLAAGFKAPGWSWELEYHYHHLFQTDKAIAKLLTETDLIDRLYFQSVNTSVRRRGQQFLLDSPLSLLACPVIDIFSRIRVGATLAFLKFNPFWQFLEKITAHNFLRLTMGEKAYQELWQPLFAGKFGRYSESINAAWFWARIHTRTAKLGYYQGGFGQMTKDIANSLVKSGVKISYGQKVKNIAQLKDSTVVTFDDGQKIKADKVLVTLPSTQFINLFDHLPTDFINNLKQLKSLGAVTVVMELNRPFFTDQTYWLNINEDNWPILAVVEHTQFQPAKYYGQKHIVYVGKYLDPTDDQYHLSDEKLLELYHPYLEKLSPGYKKNLQRFFVFHSPFAQPVVERRHNQILPSLVTPLPSVYWASMQHIYPYDRGTNYAVALGVTAANLMIKNV